MKYDFDKEIERRGTNSLKWDFAVRRGKPADVLPLWVADMDFQAAPPILDALKEAVAHGCFGYSETGEAYHQAVAAWLKNRFDWEPQREWLVKTPGVTFALAMAVRAFTKEGESVLIQPPVYYPFYEVIRDNRRRIITNELILRDGRYEIDFADLESKIRENDVKLFLFCSPHNPVCRVWSGEELRKLGEICGRYGVFVVSDEIHCDLAFPEHPHTVFLNACPELERRTIVCNAPSKTFNLAGLQVSNIWIPDRDLRRKFRAEIAGTGYSQLNTLGLVAAQAAYAGGGEWLDECRAYLRGNLDFLRNFLKEELPEIHLVEPEGTYFAWLDCSGLGLSEEELDDLVTERAKLWLDAGHIFGGDSGQFQRVVLACPRKTLARALRQLEQAIHER